MTLNTDHLSRRLSWSGILAGLVMGVVTTLTIIALGTVITALTGLSLTGVGIAAAIWTALAALIGAYAAGLTAVRASAPATHNSDGLAAMTHDDATLTGLVTGGLIVLASSLFAFNAARGLLNTATSVVGGVAGAAATAGAAAATVTATKADAAAMAGAATPAADAAATATAAATREAGAKAEAAGAASATSAARAARTSPTASSCPTAEPDPTKTPATWRGIFIAACPYCGKGRPLWSVTFTLLKLPPTRTMTQGLVIACVVMLPAPGAVSSTRRFRVFPCTSAPVARTP